MKIITKMKNDITYPRELNLKLIKVYKMTASDGERISSVKGYYADYNVATVDAQKAGWYDSNGDVESVLMYTDGTYIYDIQYDKLLKLTDVDRKYKEDMMNNVKSKLTAEEIEFLGLNKK